MFKIFLLLIFILIIYCIIGNLRQKPGNFFDMYVGVPGSGKTTFAAWFTKQRLKKAKKNKCSNLILCNVPIRGTKKVVKSDIGHYEIKNCLLLMDEAGIDYNNRNFKSFSDDETYFYKFHRHYNVDIVMFSQDFDVDLKLRKLCTRIYIVNKSIIPGFIKRKLITKNVGVDNLSHQLIDEYKFATFGTKWIYAPKLWKMFNTLDRKELPTKVFEDW